MTWLRGPQNKDTIFNCTKTDVTQWNINYCQPTAQRMKDGIYCLHPPPLTTLGEAILRPTYDGQPQPTSSRSFFILCAHTSYQRGLWRRTNLALPLLRKNNKKKHYWVQIHCDLNPRFSLNTLYMFVVDLIEIMGGDKGRVPVYGVCLHSGLCIWFIISAGANTRFSMITPS